MSCPSNRPAVSGKTSRPAPGNTALSFPAQVNPRRQHTFWSDTDKPLRNPRHQPTKPKRRRFLCDLAAIIMGPAAWQINSCSNT